MLKRLALTAAVIALAGCAGLEPAGRNARNGEYDAPRTAPVAPAPRPAPTPPPVYTPPPSAAATVAPPPVSSAPTSAPPAMASAPPPTIVASPPPVASSAAAPPPDQPVSRRTGDEEVVVPGAIERQVRPPPGDPRSPDERMHDINAWDRCVTSVQSAYESDPMRPQLNSPEEYCSNSLGMADRTAVPQSRLDRIRHH